MNICYTITLLVVNTHIITFPSILYFDLRYSNHDFMSETPAVWGSSTQLFDPSIVDIRSQYCSGLYHNNIDISSSCFISCTMSQAIMRIFHSYWAISPLYINVISWFAGLSVCITPWETISTHWLSKAEKNRPTILSGLIILYSDWYMRFIIIMYYLSHKN